MIYHLLHLILACVRFQILFSLNIFLSSHQIQFDYIDITDNDIAIKMIEKINNGKRIIPTILVDDKVYVNPGISELMKIISK